MYYNNRLRAVRAYYGIKQTEVADNIGIKRQQYSRYEKGINVMPVTILSKVCEYLNISADYILGFTNEMRTLKSREEYEVWINSLKDKQKDGD